jgi:hypothetical protein
VRTIALIASCPDCGGLKAVECEAQDNNEQVQRWIDRGDIVGAERVDAARLELWRCECGKGKGRSVSTAKRLGLFLGRNHIPEEDLGRSLMLGEENREHYLAEWRACYRAYKHWRARAETEGT